jgi:hypothetical protein
MNAMRRMGLASWSCECLVAHIETCQLPTSLAFCPQMAFSANINGMLEETQLGRKCKMSFQKPNK